MRYKLVYENEIGRVEFSLESGLWLESADSLTKQDVKITSTASSHPIGEKTNFERVLPKTFTLRGTMLGRSDGARQQLTHVIAPLTKGRLIYNDRYFIDVAVKSSPAIERYRENAKFSFTLYAAYPYWRRCEGERVTLAGLRPLFSFPWNLSNPSPFRFSENMPVGYVTVDNLGEAPTGWEVRLLALDTVVNPRVYDMKSGQYVRMIRTMETGETIVINTAGEELTVKMLTQDGEETDGFPFLDIGSMPFQLQVGENYIKTDAESGEEALRAAISYHACFVGV